jgi:CBS domain-containing protein
MTDIKKVDLEVFEVPLNQLNLPTIINMSSSMPFLEAAKMMKEKRIGSLTLGSEGKIEGIFTERDVISKAPLVLEDPMRPLSDLMTPEPLTLSEEGLLSETIAIMSSREFRHLPLVNENGEVTKMISIKDVLKFVTGLFDEHMNDFEAIVDWDKSGVNLQESAILYDFHKEKGTLSEDVLDIPLKRIVNTQVTRFSPDTPIATALEVLHTKREALALIMDFETELEGVITERDILYKVFAENLDLSLPLSEIMTREPHVLSQNHQFGNAIANMFTYGYRNIPIVNQEGYPVGNISLLELLIFLSNELGLRNILKFF